MNRQEAGQRDRVYNGAEALATAPYSLGAYVFAVDSSSHKILFANGEFKASFGAQCVGQTCYGAIHGAYNPACAQCLVTGAGEGEESLYFDSYSAKTDEWLGTYCSRVNWFDGRDVILVGCRDITEKRMYDERVSKLAFVDYLTGLPNRHRCDIELAEMFDCALETGECGYLIFIDMDDFKIVNDGYGHDYGDALLKVFADYLRAQVKGEAEVYRFGGDEFIILTNPGDDVDIRALVERLSARAQHPWQAMGKQFYCTLSMGIAPYPQGDKSAGQILRDADTAMYHAKKRGKNNYTFFNEKMGADVMRRVETEKILRESISNDYRGFEVYYQPSVACETGQIIGCEAFVRWVDTHGKMMMPDRFIPLSEYLGLIVPLGEFIMHEAMCTLKQINDSEKGDFFISVKLSAKQYMQNNIAQHVAGMLEETGANPRNFILEITEAAEDKSRMAQALQSLKGLGFSLSMADFGMGYSSFENLRSLPLDIVKINRSFVKDMARDDCAESFLKLFVELGRTMGKDIFVEGIESAEEMAKSKRLGANVLQGFHFFKPMPQTSLFSLLDVPLRAAREEEERYALYV